METIIELGLTDQEMAGTLRVLLLEGIKVERVWFDGKWLARVEA
jgi:hypothetical protein